MNNLFAFLLISGSFFLNLNASQKPAIELKNKIDGYLKAFPANSYAHQSLKYLMSNPISKGTKALAQLYISLAEGPRSKHKWLPNSLQIQTFNAIQNWIFNLEPSYNVTFQVKALNNQKILDLWKSVNEEGNSSTALRSSIMIYCFPFGITSEQRNNIARWILAQ